MLTFYHGTHLEPLADRLLSRLDGNPPDDPLDPEIFVVQNHGIGQWLSLYMAGKEGIAANLEFEFPSERIWKLIRSIDDDIPQTLPSDRGPMTWSLMELLSDDNFLSDFDNLWHYISTDDPGRTAMRSWKLASKIADVFDQYLIYRPGMILNWEKERPHYQTGTGAEKWQARLWNRLVSHWQKNGEDTEHRARLLQQLLDHLDQRNFDEEELPSRLTVFGVSEMPPPFIEVMVGLSRLTDVDFYHLAVDPEVTDATDFDNPLLQSLGTQGTDFMAQFARHAQAIEDVEWQSVETSAPGGESAFCKVQKDVIEDESLTGNNRELPEMDASIQLHSCHSPMREVEVLYDRLLAMLDEKPELHPDDILIMVSDIETYVPVIEAVFTKPDEGQPEIPYHIADRGAKGADTAIQTFLGILELCESRFRVTEVMDLLDAAPVRETFGFSEDDLNKLEIWTRDNRIRWGIDGLFKEKIALPESDHFTWRSGLNRMLLGYMMKPDEEHLHDGIYPYGEIESTDDTELAGRFARFLNALFDFSRRADTDRSPADWRDELNRVVNRFLPDSRDYFWEVSQIREVLDKLTGQASLGGYGRELSFSILRRWLQEQLQEPSTGGGRIGRGVTFSSQKPMRSIPFEVIGMIGMDEGAFPQSKIPIEFDLMHLDPQTGDPDRAKEDRYLFLENLLSARSGLYFSYVGQSNRQDSQFPPSVVLREFLDYLQEYYGWESQKIVREHRLQAFSSHYFEDESPHSYSRSQLRISRQLARRSSVSPSFFDNPLDEPGEEWKQLTVDDLISFFRHPAQYLLRNRLGIYLQEERALTEDREPFELQRLDKYKVEQELLSRYLKERSLESYEKIMRSRDMLPEGWSGEQSFRQKVTEVRDFGSEIQQRLDEQPLPDREVDIRIKEFRITGTLSNIYPDAQLCYRFGKARAKHKAEWWIRHLLFQRVKPADHPGDSLLCTWEDNAFEVRRLTPVEEAGTELAKLLELYWKGLRSPLPLYGRSSYAYAEAVCEEEKREEEGIAEAVSEWEPSWNGYPGEGDDAYTKLVTGGQKPFGNPEFAGVSRQFWKPFFQKLTGEGG